MEDLIKRLDLIEDELKKINNEIESRGISELSLMYFKHTNSVVSLVMGMSPREFEIMLLEVLSNKPEIGMAITMASYKIIDKHKNTKT